MVSPGFTRWALIIVLVALGLSLVTAATVVMASAILQPQVVPGVRVEPEIVKPGDIVLVTGRGWPALKELVLVIALSPTREFVTEQLLPVGAAAVALDGTFVATFVYPSEVPWTALREAWVVVRPPVGNLQAFARLLVRRPQPTPTPTICPALTPLAGQQQLQGIIVQVAFGQGFIVIRPMDGSPDRGIAIGTATVAFLDGRPATFSDLKVGLAVAAVGWFDSGGTLLAQQIIILEGAAAAVAAVQAPIAVCTAAPAAVSVCIPTAVCVPVCPTTVPVKTATPRPAATVCKPTACPTATAVRAPTSTPAPTCAPAPKPTWPTPVRSDRWTAEFFANPSLAGAPVAVREHEVIDFNWFLGPPLKELPVEGYSVRWTGIWHFPRSCRYRFLLLLKGAARLKVDGRVLLDLWGCFPAAEYPAEAFLSAGPHDLELEFRNTEKAARVQLRWEYGAAAP
ncbi:MAG: hypothetical protein K6V36_00975 [Anaerolineae bacterium]|nr:hypothetical protein [Anaerolineae bacterium]